VPAEPANVTRIIFHLGFSMMLEYPSIYSMQIVDMFVDISILYQEKIKSRLGIYAQNTRELNIGPEYGF
jgi:hypothetical protein